jgi:hypothetical protein
MSIEYGADDLPDTKLSAISEAAAALIIAQSEVAQIEESLKAAKERVRNIEEGTLPEAMGALGMKDFTLANGDKISVREIVAAQISDANQPSAFAWLREHGKDSLIKRVIALSFGKGEDKIADALLEKLTEEFPDTPVVNKESVHAATLKSFVTERLTLEKPTEDGQPSSIDPADRLPRTIFGVYVANKAIVSKPKAKKSKSSSPF